MKFFKLAIALAGIALFSACSNDVESFLDEGNGVRGYNASSQMRPKPRVGNGPVVSKPTTTTTTDQSTQSRGYNASGNMQPKPRVGTLGSATTTPIANKPTTTSTNKD